MMSSARVKRFFNLFRLVLCLAITFSLYEFGGSVWGDGAMVASLALGIGWSTNKVVGAIAMFVMTLIIVSAVGPGALVGIGIIGAAYLLSAVTEYTTR